MTSRMTSTGTSRTTSLMTSTGTSTSTSLITSFSTSTSTGFSTSRITSTVCTWTTSTGTAHGERRLSESSRRARWRQPSPQPPAARGWRAPYLITSTSRTISSLITLTTTTSTTLITSRTTTCGEDGEPVSSARLVAASRRAADLLHLDELHRRHLDGNFARHLDLHELWDLHERSSWSVALPVAETLAMRESAGWWRASWMTSLTTSLMTGTSRTTTVSSVCGGWMPSIFKDMQALGLETCVSAFTARV